MLKQQKEQSEQTKNFIFDVTPGLEVLNAKISSEEIKIDNSIFTPHQMVLINRMISVEVSKEVNQIEKDFHIKLTKEKEIFEAEKEKFDIERESFEAEKKSIWQNGNQAGVKQTQNQLLTQVTILTDQLKKSIESLKINTDEILQNHKEEILELIMKISRKIINTEIQMNPEIVLHTVKNCLECVNEKTEIRILVNSKDWTIVTDNLKQLEVSMELPDKVEIIPTDSIEQGGCRVEFKSGSIDADIEKQFSEIQRKLLKEV